MSDGIASNENRSAVAELAEHVEMLAARNHALADALRNLIAYVRKTGGYMRHQEQVDLRRAEQVLAENERT